MIVIFSPEDLKIVKDEPEKRRKFIDRELSQISPKYYNSLSNYKKISFTEKYLPKRGKFRAIYNRSLGYPASKIWSWGNIFKKRVYKEAKWIQR